MGRKQHCGVLLPEMNSSFDGPSGGIAETKPDKEQASPGVLLDSQPSLRTSVSS